MHPLHLLFVAAGGALGAVLRVLLSSVVPAGRLPWGTLAVNVLGSLLIGWLMARFGPPTGANARWHAFLVAGMCGGFTTFSTFSWQLFDQVRTGELAMALGHALLAVSACLVATWLGWRLARV